MAIREINSPGRYSRGFVPPDSSELETCCWLDSVSERSEKPAMSFSTDMTNSDCGLHNANWPVARSLSESSHNGLLDLVEKNKPKQYSDLLREKNIILIVGEKYCSGCLRQVAAHSQPHFPLTKKTYCTFSTQVQRSTPFTNIQKDRSDILQLKI